MEKQSFFRNGVIKLPPGFRFHPTDEELIVHYLRRKVFSCPLPASIIPQIDLGKYSPWDLPGDTDQEKYFFTVRESRYQYRNRSNRVTEFGYWKATGSDKKIVACRTNEVIGMKKNLVFYRGKPSNGARTDWIMHEYRLTEAEIGVSVDPQRKNLIQNPTMQSEGWILCRIFQKKRSNKKNRNFHSFNQTRSFKHGNPGFKNDEDCSLLSSAASTVTELSSSASSFAEK